MISLLLAGVLVSGSISQTVSSSHVHIGPNGGGTVTGTSVNVSKTFPKPIVYPSNLKQGTNGTQTLHYCNFEFGKKDVKVATTDPRGCAYAGLWLWI